GGHEAGTGRVLAATRAAGGQWSSVTTIHQTSSDSASYATTSYPNVEIAPTGAAIVAWREDRHGGPNYDWNWRSVSRADSGSAWSSVAELSPRNPGQGNHLTMTQYGFEDQTLAMEMDGDGNATALWGRFATDVPTLETRDFDPQTGWTEREVVWTGGNYAWALSRPTIATNPDGDRIAAFEVHGPAYGQSTDFTVLGMSRPAGAADWTVPISIINEVNTNHIFVSTSIDDQGNGVVGWSRDAGQYDRRPQVAGFDGAGPRLAGLVAPDGEPGQELQFGVEAVDVWSPPASTPHWTFGTGQGTADGSAPKHTYTNAGTYPVSVAATDGRGMTTTRTTDVRVAANQAPTAAFTIAPNPATTGQTVTFDATGSTDADGAVSQYAWDLDGDGTYGAFEAAETVTATYAGDGSVTVGLKVKDTKGAVSQPVTHVLVVSNRLPTLGASAVTATPASAQTFETITLAVTGAADPDGTIDGYEWDLDGSTVNGYEHTTTAATTTRQYARSGSHTVRVRAIDDDGGRSTPATATVAIVNRAPVAIITPTDTSVQQGGDVAFSGAGSSDQDGTVASYEWDLDGNPATGADGFEASTVAGAKSRVFDAVGDHSVRLRVVDDEGARSAAVQAVVHVTEEPVAPNARPTAKLAVTPNPVLTGTGVTFSAAGSADEDGSVAAYEWDLDGDAANGFERTTTDDSVTRTYDSAGTRQVRLRVIDNRGERSGDVAATLVVNAPPPGEKPAEKPVRAPAPADHVTTKQATGVTVQSAQRIRKVPSVLGKNVDDARDLLDKAHHVDYEIDWVHSTKRSGARVGDVVGQDPDAGDKADSGPADLLKMELDVYAGPRRSKDDCPPGMKAALRDADLDLGRALIEETKCEIDEVDFIPTKGADEVEIGKVGMSKDGDEVDLGVEVPTATEHQGLFMIVRGFRRANKQQLDEHWRIVADAKIHTCFAVQVIDRSRSLVANASVMVDASDAGGSDFTATTNANGFAELCGRFPNGLAKGLDIVARAEGRNGHALNGTTRIAVKAYNAVKTYRTTLGDTMNRATASAVPTARAANLVTFLQNAWNAIASLGQSTATFFTDVGAGMQSKANAIGEAVKKGWAHAASSQLAVPGNLNPGGLVTGGAGVIAAGGGNVIAAGGGNVIAAGGGNVIAAGGGNVIAAGGGNVIAAGGGNVIAPGGGNVIAAGGGNVIAAGGGNFAGGGARAASTRSARAARAGGSGWLVRGSAQVLSVGGAGAIVTSTPKDVLFGGGHFTSKDHGGDVKDAKSANVVQPDKANAPDVWVLQRIE
ncbi:MAG: CBM44, partial [uncultured Solirubrobacteraceae bacterium]